MWQNFLIIALAICTTILTILLIIRHRRERAQISLTPESVDELIRTFETNLRSGKIPSIAGHVSNILNKHLDCTKILFLKNYKDHLEVNYVYGLKGFSRKDMRLRMNKMIHSGLRKFSSAEALSGLYGLFADDYTDRLQSLGFQLFFPIFYRDRLLGLYLISSPRSKDDMAMQLLTSALALNLATAYHIHWQELKLKGVESSESKATNNELNHPQQSLLMRRLPEILKIQDSRRLTGELMDTLRRDCGFNRMVFYAPGTKHDGDRIILNWSLNDKSRNILKDSINRFAGRFELNKITDLNNPQKQSKSMESAVTALKKCNIDFATSLMWADGQKALLAWTSKTETGRVMSKLTKFTKEAMPIINNIRRLEKAEEMSYTDALTDVYNYRFFNKRMVEELDRAKRYKHNMALLILDVDDLKHVNDTYGHQAGDELLKSFSSLLINSVRANDIISRYGGDEFCLIMPETDRVNSGVFMERLRRKIEDSWVAIKESADKLIYSVSMGGAVYPEDADQQESLLRAADLALLAAKSMGRNRVQMFHQKLLKQSAR